MKVAQSVYNKPSGDYSILEGGAPFIMCDELYIKGVSLGGKTCAVRLRDGWMRDDVPFPVQPVDVIVQPH